MEVTRRRGRRRKKLLDDLKDRRGYSHSKEEALDRTMWRHRFGGGFGPVVRQNTEWMAEQPPRGPRPPHYQGFMITLRHTTFGRTPLDEWSARRRDLYLSTNNTHNRQTSMPPAGFPIPASERQQTGSWDRATTGTGSVYVATITWSWLN